jgi:hypothetical protein
VIDGFVERARRARTLVARATALPFGVRCGVYLCGLLAAVVAFPAGALGGRLFLLLALVALWPAVAPRGRGPTVVALLVVAGWLLSTTWYAQPVVLWRLLALATLLYLQHSLAALAAVLPTDAVVELDVAALWLARAAGVTLASAVVTVAVLSVAASVGGRPFLGATLLGLAVAVAAAALLARLLRRPRDVG